MINFARLETLWLSHTCCWRFFMKHKNTFVLAGTFAILIALVACSSGPAMMKQSMPQSGFLPNYSLLEPIADTPSGTRVWRYRKAGVNPGVYTGVIIDPVYLNQFSYTKEITPEVIAQTKYALQESIRQAVENKGGIAIVSQPGPGVVRISVGITGAEVSADGLMPWNFTPIGLAASAATYAAGVNSKTPALIVENKFTDSLTKEFLGGGLIVIEGETFRTGVGSIESFQGMAKRAVVAAVRISANPSASSK